jgi:hypothetical protein
LRPNRYISNKSNHNIPKQVEINSTDLFIAIQMNSRSAAISSSNIWSISRVYYALLLGIGKTGYKACEEVSICLDSAASELREDGKYKLFKSTGKFIISDEMVKFWENWANQYPIVLITSDALS